jgi:hypothetical protein
MKDYLSEKEKNRTKLIALMEYREGRENIC